MKKLIGLTLLFSAFVVHAFTLEIEYLENVSIPNKERLENIKFKVEDIAKTTAFRELVYKRSYKCFNNKNLPQNVLNLDDVLNYLDHATAKVKIKFFTENSLTVGATVGNTISFNTVFFNKNSDAAVANTLFHESLHSIHFGHCGLNNVKLYPWITKSIPYKFGDYIQQLF